MSPYGLNAGMGYNQLPFGSSLVQNLEQYMMTSSRVSSLLQMSLQSVAMTVQAATQLAQTGVMLQQEHSLQQQQLSPQPDSIPQEAPPLEQRPDQSTPQVPPSFAHTLLPAPIASLLDLVRDYIPIPPAYIRDHTLLLLAKLAHAYHKRQWRRKHRQLCLVRPNDKSLLALRMRAFVPPQCEGEPSRWWWLLVAALAAVGWRVARLALRLGFKALAWLLLGDSSAWVGNGKKQAYRKAWASAFQGVSEQSGIPGSGIHGMGMYNSRRLQDGSSGWGGMAAFTVVCGIVVWVILRAVKAARAQQAQMRQLQEMQAQAMAQNQSAEDGASGSASTGARAVTGGNVGTGMTAGMGTNAMGGLGMGATPLAGSMGGLGMNMGLNGMGMGLNGFGTGLPSMAMAMSGLGGLNYNTGLSGYSNLPYGGINSLAG